MKRISGTIIILIFLMMVFLGAFAGNVPCVMAEDETVYLDLPSGWSMFSLPVIPPNPELSELFPDAKVVYGYERDKGYVRIEEDEELNVGKGYWILFDNSQIKPLTGRRIYDYPLSLNEGGWEMIGGCTLPAQASADSANINVIYGFDQEVGYRRVLKSEKLLPGKGYWIRLSDSTGLRIDSGWPPGEEEESVQIMADSNVLSYYNNEVNIDCSEWTDPAIAPYQVRVFYWKDNVYQGPYDLPGISFDLTVDDGNDHVMGRITIPDSLMDLYGITGPHDYIKIRLTMSNLQTKHSGAIYVDTMVEPDVVERYMAVLPQTLHIGEKGAVSLSLFSGDYLAKAKVQMALLKEGERIFETEDYIYGKGKVGFEVPQIETGDYTVEVRANGFEDSATVKVAETLLVFVETDKPIYKPGQTMCIRVITLNSELKPVSKDAAVEIQDAKGIKIFRKEIITDEYGLSSFDMPISAEPNLGVWKIIAYCGDFETQSDVRVEEYVLPKYEVKAELPKEWFLVEEPIKGKIKAEYSFGKPVKGELVIEASKYEGVWDVYETVNMLIDGEADFEISAPEYVAGVPAAGGMGNVTLDITVKETNTGYEENMNKIVTISDAPLNIQIIPESSVFKPTLPIELLIITETPDNKPRDAIVSITATYLNEKFEEFNETEHTAETLAGKALLTLVPPGEAIAMVVEAEAEGASASKALESGYSPSGNFIHVEQISQGIPKVGEKISFKVHSTSEAVNFYYEIISRGTLIFTGFTGSSEISLVVTPSMAPSSKILVYQILQTSEVAADCLPFSVEADYPHSVTAEFSKEEAKPGDELEIMIKTEGRAKVGITAVDKSVFILAEKRLNLQQVFDEIERLYMKPQVELHSYNVYREVDTKGAEETFKNAEVIVLSNNNIPKGEEHINIFSCWWCDGKWEIWRRDPVFWAFMALNGVEDMDGVLPPQAGAMPPETGGLAEVERVRQFFPETWLWKELITDEQGNASFSVEVPDTITTWMLNAVGLSQEKGFGVGEDTLKAFQPFFIKIDLPYSAIRGEEFPVSISIYNYLGTQQSVSVVIEPDEWFDLLDDTSKMVTVGGNDIGGAQFKIRPKTLGIQEVKVTARSSDVADAMIKQIIIEPEGVEREAITNIILNAGDSKNINTFIPGNVVEGSARAYIAATSSYLTQSIEGLDELLKMPSGCGEQNMIFLAPDVYIVRYLKATDQLKPEIMAKAENLMITGYQRELTYRRDDGSFSAFGQRDDEGSLWLTAFVLKVFSQAMTGKLMYIDEGVLNEARAWITGHQNEDGSFDPVGFVHHKEMIGGLQGQTALTAFVTIALQRAGEETGSDRGVEYLEDQLYEINDPYTIALTALALELGGSSMRNVAYDKLMGLSQEDENGLYWPASGAEIEATGYAAMALLEHEDKPNAGRAVKWLVSKRNAYGGYGSTQDTVVALEAVTEYSSEIVSNVNLTLEILWEINGETGTEYKKEIAINSENFDVLQIIEVPIDKQINIRARGTGEAVIQNVKRFNLPEAAKTGQTFNITVDYDTNQIEVNDLIEISVTIQFTPPISIEAGMVVLDISVPTGFTALTESIETVVEEMVKIKRYEVAARKVIFYIENMLPGEKIAFDFNAKAMYPVKAKGVSSQAYSYYKPEMNGETLSEEIIVSER
ncbi:MAG: alpha-2-macroglobulin family protein [bacterium]